MDNQNHGAVVRLCDGLVVQSAHDHYVVLDAKRQQVLNASGPAAEVLGHVLRATPIPGHLSDAVAMLTQLHVVAAPDHVSRRDVLRSGVTAATVGVVVLALPTAAAASSAPVSAPDGVVADAGDTEVIISWLAVPGASGYEVYFRINGSVAAFGLAEGEALTTTSWRATDLTNDIPYDFYVIAISGGNPSTPSEVVTATPRAFAVVSTLTLTGQDFPRTAITDGTHAYFGRRAANGQVVKVDLTGDMTVVDSVDLGADSLGGLRSSITDGTHGYFGTQFNGINKINLGSMASAGKVTLTLAEDKSNALLSAITDGTYGYFGTETSPGQVVKVNLSDMTQVGRLELATGENILVSSVRSGDFGYFGTFTTPGKIVKVQLSDMSRVGELTLGAGEANLESAVTDGTFGYFGTAGGTVKVVKVNLTTMSRVGDVSLPDLGGLYSAVISGAYGYFGSLQTPGRVAKVHLATLTVVGVLTLAAGQNNLLSAVASDGFGYFATLTEPGQVVKIRLGS
jgi:hypothetical protein